jgi:peptide/nickel transport system ATP-binding protein
VSIIEIRDLVVKYGRGHRALRALDGVSLTLERGTTLGIVGESGCGKSTLARCIVGLIPVASGTISLDGADVSATKDRGSRSFRRRVQMIFQDPRASLDPRMSVQQTLVEALRMREPRLGSRAEERAEIARLLSVVGLQEDAGERYPHQFSGGQRQRIAIIRALAVGASVLINDEVTSALDVSIQATILNLLKELQDELGLTFVFVSHDLSVVRVMSNVIVVMYLGRVMEVAETEDLFENPTHPYTQALLGSAPSLSGERKTAPISGEIPDPRNPPSGCRFHTRCPVGPRFNPERTICMTEDPSEGADGRLHQSACHFSPSAEVSVGAVSLRRRTESE